MKKINTLIADDIDLTGVNLLPKNKFNVAFKPGIDNHTIIKAYQNYDCLLIKSTRIVDRYFLENCNMKLIATCSRGFDNIDTKYALKKKIKILYSSGANCISAAEHTFGLILEIFKRISFSENLIRTGNFKKTDFDRRELSRKKIGIIGIGKVGSYVAKLASAFGMKIIANDIDTEVKSRNKFLSFKSLGFLLRNSDIISVHIPLDEKNRKFLSKEKLNLINKDAVFINTSRGGIVDEKTLIKLLSLKKIRFAGLDVFENEPDINPDFLMLENAILTNHIAGKTAESRVKMSKDIFRQIKDYYENKEL